MKWLSVREASELLRIKERAVRKAAQQEKYDSQYVNDGNRGGIAGGQKLQIALESLPEEAQKKYWDRLDAARHAEYFEFMARTTENQRNTADRRAWIVKRFGGNGIYLPYFEAISRRARNRRIVSDRNAGMSCKQLSIKYHLTAVQILNILNTAKDSNKEAKHQ
ncbi:MAG: Mor transcription activator family protein [Acutalibacteraceae bacterium]